MVSTIMDEAKRERASAAELRRFSTIVNNLTKFENDTRFSFNPCFFLKSPSRTTEQLPSQIQSGNPIVDKCINVLATLASEVNILDDYAHRHVFPTILLYGEDADQSMQVKGHELVEISEFLPFLQEASMFVSRCNEVFRNILLQLHSVFSSKEDVWKRMRGRSLKGVWNTLGQLLSLLVILDEVIQNQKLVKLHWSSFLRSLSLLQYNPSQFNIDSTRLKSLQTVLTQMDAQLLTGVTFQNCCQQKLGVDFNADSKFVEHLRTVTLAMYETWEKAAAEDLPDQRQLIGILSLAVLHSFLSRAVEKRLIRSIWNSNRKLPFFNIMGNIIWTPCDFLLKSVQSISKVIDSKSISSMRSLRFAVYEQQEASLSNEFTINANNAFLEWQSQMVTSLEHWPNESVREEVSRRISLFLKGVRQADSLCRLLKSIVAGHLCENRPIARSSAINVLHLIEIVMSIKKTFFAWWDEILESCQQAVQQWSSHLLTLVSKIKDSLRSYSEPSYETMDVISMFRVAENALCGAVTVDSLFIVELVLDMAHHTKLFSSTDLKELEEIISRMNSTCDFGRIIARVCDCSFLFWHRALISTYFESLLEDFSANVESFFAALNDVGNMIKMCSHPQREVLLSHFQTDTRKLFEKEFMMKLYSAVENDLRFSLHSSLRVGAGESSASRDISVLHLMKLLQVEPFSLGDEVIDIKRLTELYLEKSFYNLTAVALHDSHIYTTMRLIAAKKYGLNLCESSLPFQKLDQGLDVLAVTRELGHFVSKYSYNLNAQFFIEKESKNKQLNVLTVEHIANSIRTHGMGIMNTAINCAYQCLKTKLFTFSQFLYDDQVKGQLIKEARYFRKNSDKLGKKYPVDRAERLNKDIRQLGASASGQPFFDQFRQVVTEVGNIIGFVRLVKSGGMEASSQSLDFLPNFEDLPSFHLLTTNACLSQDTIDASDLLDQFVASFSKNLHFAGNYLQILVEAFATEFRNFTKFSHHRVFYVIIPALSVNYVEYILAYKGILGRRTHQNNIFADEGVVLGIAFILTMLDQVEAFESLHWFQSICDRCSTELSSLTEPTKTTQRGNIEPSQTLRSAKLQQYQKEFHLFSCTFNSAMTLFKSFQEDKTVD